MAPPACADCRCTPVVAYLISEDALYAAMDQELASVLAVDECAWLVLEYAFDYPLIRHLLNRGGAVTRNCIRRARLVDFPLLIEVASLPICKLLVLQHETHLPSGARCVTNFVGGVAFNSEEFTEADYEMLDGWLDRACMNHQNNLVQWLLAPMIHTLSSDPQDILINLARLAHECNNAELVNHIRDNYHDIRDYVGKPCPDAIWDVGQLKLIYDLCGVDRQCVIKRHIVARACLREELRLARWMASEFSITARDLADEAVDVLEQLCLKGPNWLPIAQWWADLSELTANAFDQGCQSRKKMDATVDRWISQWFGLPIP